MANFNNLINLEGLTEYDSKIKEHIGAQVEGSKIKLVVPEMNLNYAKSYIIKQGEQTIGTIDIPKDMVVSSGKVVVDPEGQAKGTYIELTLANNDGTKIYIDAATLVDNYTAASGAAQVQLAIDASSREISAKLVNGGVNTDAIAAGAVTKAKLGADVKKVLDNVITVVDSGECGATGSDDVTWILYSDGLVEINGSGTVQAARIAPDYKEDVKEIIINNGITKINSQADFTRFTNLSSIKIPDSMTFIGEHTFADCVSLKEVNIPSSIIAIGSFAFSNCTNLASINIPNSVTIIGENAFEGCNSLIYVNIPNSVTSIGSLAFVRCNSLRYINIPNSVTGEIRCIVSVDGDIHVYFYEASSENDINIDIETDDALRDATKHYGEIYDPALGCAVKTKVADIPTVTVASKAQIDELFSALDTRISALEAAAEVV